jgi:ATP-dependent Clp protease ATP-binding subunit ClpB
MSCLLLSEVSSRGNWSKGRPGKRMRTEKTKLDPNRHRQESHAFESAMRRRVVGQPEGIRAVADLYQVYCAGMSSMGRPVGNLLFLGPTGSGKTRIVEAAAEILFGDPRAVI